MNVCFNGKNKNSRFVVNAVAILFMLAVPLAVYAAGMKGGAGVATSCALKNAGKPGSIDACINGGCMALHLNDPAKRRACMNNAKQQLKKLNARKR